MSENTTTETPSAPSAPSNTASSPSNNGNPSMFVTGDDSFEVLSSIPLNGGPKEEPIVEIEETKDGLQGKNEGQKGEEGEEEVKSSTSTPEGKEEEVSGEKKPESKPSSPVSIAKMGESEIEVPDDAIFTFKASKTDISVPLKELKASYQSMSERDRLFGQFKKEKTKWEKERDVVEARFANLAGEVDKNPWATLQNLCNLYDKNPATVLPVFLAQAQKTLLELEKLPEAERKVAFDRMGLQWDKEQLDKRKNIDASKEAAKKDEEYLNQVCADNSISEEELTRAWETLEGIDGLALDKKSRRETIDLVTNYITQFERPYTKIESALVKIDPRLNDDARLKKELREIITPKDTEDDIIEIVRAYLGEDAPKVKQAVKAEEKASEEPEGETVKQSKPKKVSQTKIKPKQADEDDVFDLDELVQSYRR